MHKRKTGDPRVASLRLPGVAALSLSKTLYPLLSIGSTKKDQKLSLYDRILFD